ncbi:tripartite tricarboxylate transporter TctB family protein [Lentibacillus cibarius]|uniref:Tripartite tricarboxylate transporter TctB family protein n=1 Tax=Lentibacillus cibarius TaxID=2583219 RepID=A0A5S3QIM0_9BACI|nr:tripartite tricarboxylate transporter TctB family protein [Lentibacillus cibarius]TMN21715.1 tripartite tricarboxylate transporter TctB family protein [Lentibacillus cibarius]
MKSEIRNISTGLVLLLVSVAGMIIANNFGRSQTETLYGPDFFPKLVFTLLAICSVILFIKGIIDLKKNDKYMEINKKTIGRIFSYTILLIIYINLFFMIGFVYSTIIFLIVGQYFFGVRKIPRLIIISALTPFLLYYLFTNLFNIPLP